MFDKNLIKYIINKFGINVTRYNKNKHDTIFKFKPDGQAKGNVLLGTLIDPFLLDEGEDIPNRHTAPQESFEMAKIFLDLKFNVDVISHLRENYLPIKNYSIYVNHQNFFTNISSNLNNDCIKIAYLNYCHWLFNNQAALKRIADLKNRRNIALASYRHIVPNYAIENCDYATTMGNLFTISTYQHANKKIYRTKIPTYSTFNWPEDKNFEKCKRNFLWFGSTGLVHKGLDLVLETFSKMPNYKLTVCGPVDKDKDFVNEYQKELFETPNIYTKGWVDIQSEEFQNIVKNNIALVFPSCAEAFNGGVVTCMQAGIIPIVSLETSVDIDPSYGRILNESSIKCIEENVIEISNYSTDKLTEMSKNAWRYARNNHTLEAFHNSYKEAILDIIKKEGIFN